MKLIYFTVHTTWNVRRGKQRKEREAAGFVGNYYFCDAVWLSGTSITVSPQTPPASKGVIVVCRELLD